MCDQEFDDVERHDLLLPTLTLEQYVDQLVGARQRDIGDECDRECCR